MPLLSFPYMARREKSAFIRAPCRSRVWERRAERGEDIPCRLRLAWLPPPGTARFSRVGGAVFPCTRGKAFPRLAGGERVMRETWWYAGPHAFACDGRAGKGGRAMFRQLLLRARRPWRRYAVFFWSAEGDSVSPYTAKWPRPLFLMRYSAASALANSSS